MALATVQLVGVHVAEGTLDEVPLDGEVEVDRYLICCFVYLTG
jgi:hypothetical protein